MNVPESGFKQDYPVSFADYAVKELCCRQGRGGKQEGGVGPLRAIKVRSVDPQEAGTSKLCLFCRMSDVDKLTLWDVKGGIF